MTITPDLHAYLRALPPITTAPTTPPPTHPLVTFHLGHTPGPRNLTHAATLALPDHLLESRHDYIQWFFPLPERSPFNPTAPPLTPAVIAAFRCNPALRDALLAAFLRMLVFYGLGWEKGVAVRDDARWERASRRWWFGFGHNHLRITRILRCLRVLGLEEVAGGFLVGLEGLRGWGGPGERSWMFWDRAGRRELWIAPEEEGEEEEDWDEEMTEAEDEDAGYSSSEGSEVTTTPEEEESKPAASTQCEKRLTDNEASTTAEKAVTSGR